MFLLLYMVWSNKDYINIDDSGYTYKQHQTGAITVFIRLRYTHQDSVPTTKRIAVAAMLMLAYCCLVVQSMAQNHFAHICICTFK